MSRGGGGRSQGRSSGRGGVGGGGRGRGEYYKNKYGGGGGGRGRGGGGSGHNSDYYSPEHATSTGSGGGSYAELIQCLRRLDGKSYGAYHALDTAHPNRGWVNDKAGFTLYVERAQSDPFAPPTRCRVVVQGSKANFPPELYSNRIRSVALSDFLLRRLHESCKQLGGDVAMGGKGWSGPKGGDIQILEPCQHVLEQSAVRFDIHGNVSAQITINLPARGRSILGQAAEEILGTILPTLVQQSIYYQSLDPMELKAHVFSVEDQVWLQNQLESRCLVSFIRNGAILPRKSGVDDRPMGSNEAIPFESPKRLEISFELPNSRETIVGMGIPKGISLICGGGFHGKSTLLGALQVGVYPKIPGDGREFCMTSPNAFKIRAEDGRCVQSVDISTFINNLPFAKGTTCFSTPDASGSTSQAANIVESIEVGADVLLIDEDTCATNFMIRDDKMMQLVAPDKEPITPFVRIVRSLYDDCGISSILVIGGVGDYFDVADNIVVMDCYRCLDKTERAKQIVANSRASSLPHTASQGVSFQKIRTREIVAGEFIPNGKVRVSSQSTISYGETELDVSGLEQVVAKSQTNAISNALQRLPNGSQTKQTLRKLLEALDKCIDSDGLDCLTPGQFHGGMSRPRILEIAGAINRMRRERSIIQS